MAFQADATQRTGSMRRTPSDDNEPSWAEPVKPAVDWKKRALVVGLGVLSWVATYVGMLELIEANMGELPLVHKIIIGFSVAMLMTMVVWLLDELFKPNTLVTKLFYASGYLFLTIISVGFGFGFYWKVLESRSEASRSAEGAVTQVQGSLVAASTRLDQLQATLDQLTQVSNQKAQSERATGLSCPNSKPGDGPRRKMREDDAARFSFASEFVKGRASAVKTEMSALDGDLAKITGDDKTIIDPKTGTRNAFMQSLGRKLDNTVTGFNAFRTDPQLKQIKTDLADRAEKASFPDGAGKTFNCPDPQLQTALRGVVRAIEQLPELEKPKIAAVEGSEATIEAFRRLTASFYGLLSFKMPPSADELRDLQKKAIQSVEAQPAASAKHLNEQPGLSKRDYVPLAIAVFVDLCLLLVSMGKSHDRMGGLVSKMREAERGPVIQILSRFNDIHRDRQIRENFELFRHVVFDFHGDYYVAVPLDAPRKLNPREREDLRLETQLLSNLFASFEKEKIFTRVYSPFLTPGAIRKRLARQGSKFDRSDAFRVYRFKDGAWSDFILGAVMGAAKRVEAEKKVMTVRAEERERAAGEALAMSQSHTSPTAGFAPPQTSSTSYDPYAPHTGSAQPVMAPVPPPAWAAQSWAESRAEREARQSTAAYTGMPPAASDGRAEQQFGSGQFGAYAAYAAAEANRRDALPQNVPAFADNVHPMPQNTRAPGSGFAPDVPANSNTAPVRSPALSEPESPVAPVTNTFAEVLPFAVPGQIRPGPRTAPFTGEAESVPTNASPADWQQQLGVVMTRVTESITVPVSTKAEIPAAFLARFTAGPAQEIAVEAEPVLALTAATDEPAAHDEWSQADTALIKKYASQPGE